VSIIKLGTTKYVGFSTANPSTGARQDADVLPTVLVYANGVSLGYLPTVTGLATGRYQVQIDCTTGNGFAAGQDIRVDCAAVVAGVGGADTLDDFTIQANQVDDVAALALLQTKLNRNKFITDPGTGIATLYDDDGTTVLLQGQIFENATATQLYRGQGAERRERMT
jgi:hypothetical protein